MWRCHLQRLGQAALQDGDELASLDLDVGETGLLQSGAQVGRVAAEGGGLGALGGDVQV